MSETKTTSVVKGDSEDLIIAGWTLHANAYQIERGGKRIKLEPKPTLVLAHLARYAGQPVSREELLEAVWPGVIVSDEALTNVINKLRRAFGDDRANPRVIETIPKAGYRLIAPVQNIAPVPARPLPDNRPEDALHRRAKLHWLIPAAVLIFVAGLALFFVTSPKRTTPDPSSSGVLGQEVTDARKTRPALAYYLSITSVQYPLRSIFPMA